jgi:hypothetical protein
VIEIDKSIIKGPALALFAVLLIGAAHFIAASNPSILNALIASGVAVGGVLNFKRGIRVSLNSF